MRGFTANDTMMDHTSFLTLYNFINQISNTGKLKIEIGIIIRLNVKDY